MVKAHERAVFIGNVYKLAVGCHFADFSYIIPIILPFFTVASCDGGDPASEGSKWYYIDTIYPKRLLLAGTDNSVPHNWGLFHLQLFNKPASEWGYEKVIAYTYKTWV